MDCLLLKTPKKSFVFIFSKCINSNFSNFGKLQTATEITIESLTKECGAGEEKRLTEEAGRRVWAIVQMADTDSNDKLSFEGIS